MKGIGIEQYGDVDQLRIIELPTKQLEPDDLLISIQASGVNPVDWKVREGKLKQDFTFELPLILGWDAAGTVMAAGANVQDFHVGDDVFFRPLFDRFGTYADQIVVPASIVSKMPKGLTYMEAASLPLAGLTALQAIEEVGKVGPESRVLILAGSGGVGSLAVQIAKARGAYVAATTSTRNAKYVRELGADEVLTYDTGSIHSSVQFDFLFDTIGGSAYGDALKWMKPGGGVATIISSRDAIRPDFVDALEQDLRLRTEFVFTRPDGKNMNRIRELVEEGKVKPLISEVYPMTVDGVRKAHLSSQTGRTRGKIVLSRESSE
ncbi:2-desacetyl-2-hydroxyethyl bacteriochlorophyllide A dehydrogenase [Paenibacillus tianmuensis]|uniref:2-desacetyl-2-hydroxyethyl bacteriochlorophyllide A dehydrogenase n=1 Tax=Paenibacillus tianmuensis TaxID=624147 RepID=A0A1G4TIB4_9BACL|nr:NADP-dependent oxidoreductase [Paenibacillus tianmuensis]SCW80555.1 2-desacetyl-2-hydroxyethyl bacteriochlorophyllide A dehydrogenase [Paenibacillus tianmuensis]